MAQLLNVRLITKNVKTHILLIFKFIIKFLRKHFFRTVGYHHSYLVPPTPDLAITDFWKRDEEKRIDLGRVNNNGYELAHAS